MPDSVLINQFDTSSSDNNIKGGDGQLSLAIIQSLPIAVYTCDAGGFITTYNDAAATLWGRAPEIGKEMWSGAWRLYAMTGEPMPLSESPIAAVVNSKKAAAGAEMIVERPNGTRRIVHSYPVPMLDANGTFTGAINTLIDITEQASSDENKARLAAIVESSHDAIVSKNLNGIIRSWNKEAENLFGYTASEAVGKHISMIIPLERLSEENLIISKISKGERVDHFETVRVNKAGKKIDISLTVSPIKDEQGNIIGASKIARNISSQKTMEEKLRAHVKSLQIINCFGKIGLRKLRHASHSAKSNRCDHAID